MSDLKALKKQRFQAVYSILRDDVLAYLRQVRIPEQSVEWFKRNMDYNVPGGKLNRGISVVDSVEILQGSKLTDDECFKAALLGWGIEILQAYFLITDDIMDQSPTRRGKPCWYTVEGVGYTAIIDACMLEGAVYYLLKKYIRSEPYYADVLELFLDAAFHTDIGQMTDVVASTQDPVDLSKFSLDIHRKIVTHKASYYSFYLPVALAMRVCGISNAPTADDPYALAESILLPLGEYFQVQDDFYDFAGPPEVFGKVGTDIIDNKCSWCVNVALALATPEQRAVLDANYGRKDAEAEARVKALYEELDIRERFREYEEDAYGRIMKLIQTISEDSGKHGEVALKREVFQVFLDKIHGRRN